MATTITDYQTPQTVSAPGATTWERLDLPQNTRFVRIQSTGTPRPTRRACRMGLATWAIFTW
jgi:hypothetical protein